MGHLHVCSGLVYTHTQNYHNREFPKLQKSNEIHLHAQEQFCSMMSSSGIHLLAMDYIPIGIPIHVGFTEAIWQCAAQCDTTCDSACDANSHKIPFTESGQDVSDATAPC